MAMRAKGDRRPKAFLLADYQIAKIDEEQRRVFGYAYVAVEKDGARVVDHSGDFVEPADLEAAAYEYVLTSREANDMHGKPVTGELVESFVVTPDKLEKMGLAPDALPRGWWVGFQLDDEAFQLVKSGERSAFSIEGSADRRAA